jgi:hypothetical protein
MITRALAICTSLVLLAGCGAIESSSRTAQPINRALVAGVGDAVLNVDLRESLTNIAGKADIFGRTRPTGKIVVTYLGMNKGRVIFDRQTIRFQSTATTMNSSPVVIPQTTTSTYSGAVAGYPYHGSTTTSAPPIVLPPSGSHTQILSNDRIRHFLDVSQENTLVVQGYVISIEKAAASSVRYRIRKLN